MTEGLSDRLKARMRQIRTEGLEGILKENKTIKSNLSVALPELEQSLNSRPDLLRLIKEVYNYVESESEALSTTVAHLRNAAASAENIEELSRLAITDVAGSETMIQAKWLYESMEVDTIKDLLVRFELPALQQALEDIDQKRFIEIVQVIEAANEVRRG